MFININKTKKTVINNFKTVTVFLIVKNQRFVSILTILNGLRKYQYTF